ncbi:ArsB/NhaD family transporter, partial [Ectobacillus funiculus]
MNIYIIIPILVFLLTTVVIFWRPKGINEAWPAAIGAGIILLTGTVSYANIIDIISKIGGAS